MLSKSKRLLIFFLIFWIVSDKIWITPAFQGKQRAHEAILLVLSWLFSSGICGLHLSICSLSPFYYWCIVYFLIGIRRITSELDERHVIARKFLQRCGFQLEATLRKHKIVQNRNRNTSLYVILNSEWIDVERKLHSLLGYHRVTTKAADIDSFSESASKKLQWKLNCLQLSICILRNQ